MIRLGKILILFFLWGSHTTGAAQIVNIEDKRQDYDTTGWFGRVDLSANLTEYSSTVFTVAGSLRMDRVGEQWSWMLIGQYRSTRVNASRIRNDAYTHLRGARLLTEKLNLEAFLQWQFNEFLDLDIRALAGIGPRWALVQEEPFHLFFGLIYMYGYEEIAREEEPAFRDHRLSASVALRWHPSDWFTLASTSYYQPLLDNWAESRLSTVNSLVFNLNDRFALSTNLSISYDDRLGGAGSNIPITTYTWLNSLQFSF
jgi:hypothetical protein